MKKAVYKFHSLIILTLFQEAQNLLIQDLWLVGQDLKVLFIIKRKIMLIFLKLWTIVQWHLKILQYLNVQVYVLVNILQFNEYAYLSDENDDLLPKIKSFFNDNLHYPRNIGLSIKRQIIIQKTKPIDNLIINLLSSFVLVLRSWAIFPDRFIFWRTSPIFILAAYNLPPWFARFS